MPQRTCDSGRSRSSRAPCRSSAQSRPPVLRPCTAPTTCAPLRCRDAIQDSESADRAIRSRVDTRHPRSNFPESGVSIAQLQSTGWFEGSLNRVYKAWAAPHATTAQLNDPQKHGSSWQRHHSSRLDGKSLERIVRTAHSNNLDADDAVQLQLLGPDQTIREKRW